MSHPAVTQLKEKILLCVNHTQAKTRAYRAEKFDTLEYIWKEDREAVLKSFCSTGPKDRVMEKDDNGRDIINHGPPTLAEFKKEITKYKTLQASVSTLEGDITFDFIKLDSSKCRNSIVNMYGFCLSVCLETFACLN